MSSIKKKMFAVAKDTAEISSKYYAVVRKVPKKIASKDSTKNSAQDKVPWVPPHMPGRKPTKVYRRTNNNRNSLEGKLLIWLINPLHSEQPKLYGGLAILSAVGLML